MVHISVSTWTWAPAECEGSWTIGGAVPTCSILQDDGAQHNLFVALKWCRQQFVFIPQKYVIFATETSDPPQGPRPLHRRGPPVMGSFDSQGQTGDKGGRSHGDEREDAILERRLAESQDEKKEIRRGGNGKERKVKGSVKGVKLETGLWERGERGMRA